MQVFEDRLSKGRKGSLQVVKALATGSPGIGLITFVVWDRYLKENIILGILGTFDDLTVDIGLEVNVSTRGSFKLRVTSFGS